MTNKAYLKTFCRVYKSENENPIDKQKDEFKWYMWRIEKRAVETITGSNEDELEENFKDEIRSAIDLFADVPMGGSAYEYIEKYFAY